MGIPDRRTGFVSQNTFDRKKKEVRTDDRPLLRRPQWIPYWGWEWAALLGVLFAVVVFYNELRSGPTFPVETLFAVLFSLVAVVWLHGMHRKRLKNIST